MDALHTTTTITETDVLYARVILACIRKTDHIVDEYAKHIPHINGRDDLGYILGRASVALEEAAEALASALDEASCESGCFCHNDAYHGTIKVSPPVQAEAVNA